MKQRSLVGLVCALGALVVLAGGATNAGAAGGGGGSVSLTVPGFPYQENFDTLATSGTTNSSLPTGWYLDESGSSTRNNGQYAADNGTSFTGDTYSYGSTGSMERAFGGLQSGTLIPTIGAQFTNDTGDVMSSVDIRYRGEQWRFGATGRVADRIDFQLSTDATSLTTGTWTDVDELDFTSPINSGTVGALNGNDAAAPRGATVPLTVAPGGTFWIRWASFDAAPGADDGLAVDVFSITPTVSEEDAAPTVANTSPANGATEVPLDANITIDFSEPVAVAPSWYSISCASSGAHTASQSGGPQSYTLNPDADFAGNETCTVTVDASKVTDVDTDDPPDNMAANHVFSFTTTLPVTQIAQVQGAGHLSPFTGQLVKVEGVVIAERGSNTWIQDPTPDADPATSEALLVFGSAVSNAVVVGDHVQVRGTVTEFRPGCTPSCAPTSSAFSNLTITELASPGLGVTKLSSGNPLPAATVIGARPTEVIEDDSSTGNVETSNTFDPSQDGIDFYETLESMLVQVNNPVVVGPRNAFGEILVLADNGAGASVRTARGGIVVRDVDPGTVGDYANGDFNPERIMLDDLFVATPMVDVADRFTAAAGVMTYDFANYKIAVSSILAEIDGGLQREVTRAPRDQEIVVGTYNVENLDPTDDSFGRHADLIVNHLQSPDVLAIEEIQDNDGAANTAVTDASASWNALIAAIQASGGPTYEFRQIDPVDDQDGGQPGGNIRVGFLFRTDRGVEFIDRPGGDSTTATTVIDHPSGPRLSFSPGRVDPQNDAWDDSRKPLAGEFRMHGKKVFVIANHFASKGGDQPLFGRFQPPTRSSEEQRHAQAEVENDFVDQILAADRRANVIVLGDINDFEFSETVQILEGGVLTTLMDTLPQEERYSYVFEGNSQVLDQILVSNNLLGSFPIQYDPVHVNAEFADQASDHDPQVARIDLRGRPTPLP